MSTEQFYRFLYLVVWPFFNLFHPVCTVGREHIPEGAAVICPNHTALSDPFFVAFAFQKKNPLRVMAKIQLMRVPVIGWLLGKAGIFGVDRGHADMHAAKTALRCLKEGHKLLIFPEGTRVEEEVTGLGAQTGAFAVQPEYAIAVDVTHGKTPDGPSDGVFELGSGAAIGVGPNLHRGLTQQLIRTANAYDIAHSLEVMEGNTGTNAWTMQIVAHGIATALLSIPEKYMHTPAEVVQLSDVEAVADLMAAFLRTFDGEVRG